MTREPQNTSDLIDRLAPTPDELRGWRDEWRPIDDPASGLSIVREMLEDVRISFPRVSPDLIAALAYKNISDAIETNEAAANELERKRKVGAKENSGEWRFAQELRYALDMLFDESEQETLRLRAAEIGL